MQLTSIETLYIVWVIFTGCAPLSSPYANKASAAPHKHVKLPHLHFRWGGQNLSPGSDTGFNLNEKILETKFSDKSRRTRSFRHFGVKNMH